MKSDVVIIGAGIAGMSASIYLSRAGVSSIIIEKDVPGGQLNKTNSVKNYPGFESISGPDLAMNLFNQVNSLDVKFLYDEVVDITSGDEFIVKTSNYEITCNYVIVATGRSAKKLNLNNEDRLVGHGISYCALCDGNLYKNLDVAIIGGGNSACEDALYLSNICNKVYLIHRRSLFRAEKSLIDEINKSKNIEILYNTEVKEYIDKDNNISSIILNNGSKLDVSGVFIAIGYEPIFKMLNIDNENGYIIVDDKMHTSMDGVYAVGDAIKKDVYQLITAANEGVIAAIDIIKKCK